MQTRRQWLKRCSVGALSADVLRATGPALTIRMGLSASTLNDANPNDARAAIRVWGETFQKQDGVSLVFDQSSLFDTAGMLAAIRAGRLDTFGATINEYRQVAPFVDLQRIILDEQQAQGGYEYLLLAHRDRRFAKLADLRGKQLLVLKSPSMSLAEDWLETTLAEKGLGACERFFLNLAWSSKLSKVVLPAYFKQADACLVTGAAFATMCELNPQLAKELVVVAKSPKLVASLMGFHRAVDKNIRDAFLRAALKLHHSVPGKQALMLFQTRQLYGADGSALRRSLELAVTASRLRADGRRSG